jgi:hypothetical protein
LGVAAQNMVHFIPLVIGELSSQKKILFVLCLPMMPRQLWVVISHFDIAPNKLCQNYVSV